MFPLAVDKHLKVVRVHSNFKTTSKNRLTMDLASYYAYNDYLIEVLLEVISIVPKASSFLIRCWIFNFFFVVLHMFLAVELIELSEAFEKPRPMCPHFKGTQKGFGWYIVKHRCEFRSLKQVVKITKCKLFSIGDGPCSSRE
ncbi:hypothetical protein POM88_026900 [Heracleum sosnowskyi]|uniref:Uncharacterized protein n=1 Tax=Heracleum sosnowskyi TaxID=360622 RepID=A0AAD8I7Z1_9APIA|nr:hypothetical protein POM88_026900 [Heracleum sosnowskyi]